MKKCYCQELRECLERLFIVAKDSWDINGCWSMAQELDNAWELLRKTRPK